MEYSMKRTIKLNESQLRNIIRESIGEILNEEMCEARPRKFNKPSYWEVPDYREVTGTELYVYNPSGCEKEEHRNPENLKNALKNAHALRAYIDRDGGVHAFFYSGSWPKFSEISNAWDEDAWYQVLGEPTMKGIAKQRTVKLNDYIPGFEQIWDHEVEWIKNYREREKSSDMKRRVGGSTIYNTIPTLIGGGSVDS